MPACPPPRSAQPRACGVLRLATRRGQPRACRAAKRVCVDACCAQPWRAAPSRTAPIECPSASTWARAPPAAEHQGWRRAGVRKARTPPCPSRAPSPGRPPPAARPHAWEAPCGSRWSFCLLLICPCAPRSWFCDPKTVPGPPGGGGLTDQKAPFPCSCCRAAWVIEVQHAQRSDDRRTDGPTNEATNPDCLRSPASYGASQRGTTDATAGPPSLGPSVWSKGTGKSERGPSG
jgi:hypothetical protein